MTSTRTRIIAEAERVFDRHGFAGTVVDQLTQAAGVSTRTLYKHVGSKAGLIAAVLDERRARFFDGPAVDSVETLFDAIEDWIRAEGARGCLFLRAQSEDGEWAPEASVVITAYRTQLRELIRRVIRSETGREDDALAEQLLVLFEGATSAASYRGTEAVCAAKVAAKTLVDRAR